MALANHANYSNNGPSSSGRESPRLSADQRSQVQETTLKARLAVRRVPLEILGEIFLCMPTNLHPRNYQDAVAKVSLVCKRWREAALLASRLWCDVWVRADGPLPTYEEIFERLRRGGGHPKTLEISSPSCGGVIQVGTFPSENEHICAKDACHFLDPILPRLLKQPQFTWDLVTLNCPTAECLRRLLAQIDMLESNVTVRPPTDAWNSLHALELGTGSWANWPTQVGGQEELFSLIPSSVNSLTIRMPGEDFDWAGGDWDVPLGLPVSLTQGLTYLEITFGRLSEIMAPSLFDTLRHCINLESLTVDLLFAWLTVPEGSSGMGPFLKDGVLLPNLRRVRLSQINAGGLNALKFLRMPRLRDMYLALALDGEVGELGQRGTPAFRLHRNENFFQADPLVDLIRGDRGMASQLRSLHVKAASFCSGVLFHVLRDLPSLTRLTLEWIEFLYRSSEHDDFLMLQGYLPSLQSLEILNLKHAPDFEVPSLQQFMGGRNLKFTLTYMPNYAAAVERKRKDEEDDLKFCFGYDSDSDGKYYRGPTGVYDFF